jgi:lactate dehydrogenase-like 2-hydroxyacid dehydrogenase
MRTSKFEYQKGVNGSISNQAKLEDSHNAPIAMAIIVIALRVIVMVIKTYDHFGVAAINQRKIKYKEFEGLLAATICGRY